MPVKASGMPTQNMNNAQLNESYKGLQAAIQNNQDLMQSKLGSEIVNFSPSNTTPIEGSLVSGTTPGGDAFEMSSHSYAGGTITMGSNYSQMVSEFGSDNVVAVDWGNGQVGGVASDFRSDAAKRQARLVESENS